MAIVKMNKFTLLAFESQKAKLLEKLQNFSEVEFINLQDDEIIEKNEELIDLYKDESGSQYTKCEEKLSMAKFALEFLEEYIPKKSGLKAMREGKKEQTLKEIEDKTLNSSWEEIYDKIKEKEEIITGLDNNMTKLQTIVDTMTPWEKLDVSFEDLSSIKTPYFLGSIPKQYEETFVLEVSDSYVEIISSNNQDLFFLVVCREDKKEEIAEKLREFGFSQFKTELKNIPINIIHDNMDKIEKLQSKKFFVCESLAALDEEHKLFESVYHYYDNMVIRKEAINNFLKTENVMIIQGWLPVDANDRFSVVIDEILGEDVYFLFEEVKDEEISEVPIKLQNNSLNDSFESITEMYSVPRYDEIDPTPLLAPFYLIFFGMMVADVGYGLIQLAATLAALKFFKFDEATKKFVKFFMYLSFPVIIFGLFYGSFFGDFIKFKGLVDPAKDVNTILITSVVFGIVQIFCGLGIKAYMLIRIGKYKDALYDVGVWVLTLIAIGLLLGAGTLGLSAIAKNIAMGVMLFGMITIVLTAGREMKGKGAQLGQGAYALYGITNYVGDLVSYTRLMALGLAGGSIASALNLIINILPGAAIFIAGPLIFIFGHIFNLGLSLLGAYVHTCRLQYVEYFGKFYEGGGKAFTPFKTNNKYINLKRD